MGDVQRTRLGAPVLGLLIDKRGLGILLSAVVLLQILLVSFHLPAWPCPFQTAFHLPCPGCGMSRACAALLHGRWAESFALHPFAVLLAVGWLAVLAGALLPAGMRRRVASHLCAFERRTALTVVLLGVFLVHGLVRMALLL